MIGMIYKVEISSFSPKIRFGKCSKNLNNFLLLFSNKIKLAIRAETNKMLVRKTTGKIS